MKILVIGDSCTDVFVYGEIKRLCPEAPAPVFQKVHQKQNGGMSKNVKNNLTALGANVHIISNDDGMRKIRYVDNNSNQMIMRLDENDVCSRVENLKDLPFSHYDAIVISDYNKGFLLPLDIKYICETHNSVFIDTKKKIGDWILNAKFIKINSIEYNNNVDYIKKNNHWLNKKLIVTRGKYGCEFNGNMFDVEDVPIKDVSGAGDTFLSALVIEYIRSQDIIKSIGFAQKCTTFVVQKQGVSKVELKGVR